MKKAQPVPVSDFSKIERVLRRLKSYGPQSHASLTNKDGSYIQVAGGRVTCVVEMRDQKASRHWRAHLEKSKTPFEGEQILMFGGGHMTMQPDEILFIDDVVAMFRAFFEGQPYSAEIKWRDLSHIVGISEPND